MKKLLKALLAAALTCGGAVGAQQKPSFVDIGVETLNSAATRCGIVESSLKSIAKLTLQKNGIVIDPSPSLSTASLFIRPKVLLLSDRSCVVNMWVNISVGLNRSKLESVLENEQFRPRRDITLTLCEEGMLLAGPANNMGDRVDAALENAIKVCLRTLSY